MNPNQPDPNNPNPAATPSTPPAPDPTTTQPWPNSPETPLQTPSTVPSFEPIIHSAPIIPPDPTPTFTSIPTPAQPEPTTGFSWPSSTNPAQIPETPGIPQPGLSDLATTPLGSAPAENQTPFNPLTPDSQSEPAPSDLSHLVNPSQEPTPAYPPTNPPQAETLMPNAANGNPEVPNLPTEGNHSGIPKWVIGVGAALLLVVLAASAYFILGIGRTVPGPESVPATTEQPVQTPPVVQTQPIPTIATPPATGSAGFGTLPGTGTGATSAADLLRQRQGQ